MAATMTTPRRTLLAPEAGVWVELRQVNAFGVAAWHITQWGPPYELLAIVPDGAGLTAETVLTRFLEERTGEAPID